MRTCLTQCRIALLMSLAVTYAGGITTVTASSPVLVSVPDISGLTQAAAESMLSSTGLVVGAVTTVAYSTGDGFDPGDVSSQNPGPGAGVALGTAVDLVVVIPPPAQNAPPFDVNNDGYDDLIHIARDGDVFSTELLLSDGTDFTFSMLTGSATNNATHDKWFKGDFNGDGLMDLARSLGRNGRQGVLRGRNQPSGRFDGSVIVGVSIE